MPHRSIRPGSTLCDRYEMQDLLNESAGGRFFRGIDRVLNRHVAVHVIGATDERASKLLDAARVSAGLHDPRVLRVLDADEDDELCFVVNEWGDGVSLDLMLDDGPIEPRAAAWIVSQVADTIVRAHEAEVTHGRLVPENVLIDRNGNVRLIGLSVDAALHGIPAGRVSADLTDLGALLYAGLTGKWAGVSPSRLPAAPLANGVPLRPRKVRAGVPQVLDQICQQALGEETPLPAAEVRAALKDYVGPGYVMPTPKARPLPIAVLPPFEERVAGSVRVPKDPEAETAPEPDAKPDAENEPDPESTQQFTVLSDDSRADYGQLFAPGPRRATHDEAAASQSWSWDEPRESRSVVVEEPAPVDANPEPGQSWLRVAGVIAIVLLLVGAAVIAIGKLGAGPGGSGSDDTPTTATTPDARSVVWRVAAARSFDPYGDPPEENPEDVEGVLDNDSATTWRTNSYLQNFGPGGLKPGVGLVLDLGRARSLGEVTLNLVGEPTSISIYASDVDFSTEPTGDPAGQLDADSETARIPLAEGTRGRYVLVWLTSLPDVDGYRGEIARVVVRS